MLLGPALLLFPAHGDVQNNHHFRSTSRQQEEKLQRGSRENAPTFLRFLFQSSTDRLTVLFAKTGKASKSQPVKPSTKKKSTGKSHFPLPWRKRPLQEAKPLQMCSHEAQHAATGHRQCSASQQACGLRDFILQAQLRAVSPRITCFSSSGKFKMGINSACWEQGSLVQFFH